MAPTPNYELLQGVKTGDVGRVRAALDAGATISKQRVYYFVGLAASSGSVEVLSFLIKTSSLVSKAAANSVTDNSYNRVSPGYDSKRFRDLRTLLQAGAASDGGPDNSMVGPPLVNAEATGDRHSVVQLLRHGADTSNLAQRCPRAMIRIVGAKCVFERLEAYLARVRAAGGIGAYERARQRQLHDILAIYLRPRLPDDVLWHVVRFSPAAES